MSIKEKVQQARAGELSLLEELALKQAIQDEWDAERQAEQATARFIDSLPNKAWQNQVAMGQGLIADALKKAGLP